MNTSFPILKTVNNSMLMGDFNFDSSWKAEQAAIDPSFDDIYLTLNNGIESPTFPPSDGFPASRLDKIVCNKSSSWLPTQIYIIGRFPTPSFKG
jgi:hypothetical protein